MALRCIFLAALVVCSHSFRKNAHRNLANPDGPDNDKAAQGSDLCDKLVAEFGVDIMNRMMAAGECGMEQNAIQKDHTISAAGTAALCSEGCKGKPEFVKKLLHIEELQEMCTDKMSVNRLKMAAKGYDIAKGLKAAWEACQDPEEDPGIDVPWTVEEDEPLGDKEAPVPAQGSCKDRLKAFQAEVMAIVVKTQQQCPGVSFPRGSTDSVTLENMCTADCQREALGSLQDIAAFKTECTDPQDVAVLGQTQQGYAVAQKILETWKGPCPDPEDSTPQVAPTPVFDPVLERDPSAPLKPIVDLGPFRLDIEHVLGCGPKTTAYVDHMLELVYNSAIVQQEAVANATKKAAQSLSSRQMRGPRNYLSCAASCYSVYTKFSECAGSAEADKPWYDSSLADKAEHDDCDGAPYLEGKNGQYRTSDAAWLKPTSACPSEAKPHGWLQQLKRTTPIPCYSLYHSADKADGGEFALALSGVQRIRLEVLAAKHFITLAPKENKPALDCRSSYCKKVDKVSDPCPSGMGGCSSSVDHRSLGGCVAHCAGKYLDDL